MEAISRRPRHTSNALYDDKSVATLKSAATEVGKTVVAGTTGFIGGVLTAAGLVEVVMNRLGYAASPLLNLSSGAQYGLVGAGIGAALYATYSLSDANNFK